MPDALPGKAGRRRLRDRLATAYRAADLLDRKLRILHQEQQRLAELAQRTGEVWDYRVREARTWYDRAALLCGEAELHLSTMDGQARVEIGRETLMGTGYPSGAVCHLPEIDPAGRSPASTALVQARYAYGSALEAAVTYAAASAASRIVDAEVAQTRRAVRGIVTRRVPRLERSLRGLTIRLDETERADLVRLRWAAGRGGPG
jgi:V/A-type H+/Na+-transporting ATPase subunit D